MTEKQLLNIILRKDAETERLKSEYLKNYWDMMKEATCFFKFNREFRENNPLINQLLELSETADFDTKTGDLKIDFKELTCEGLDMRFYLDYNHNYDYDITEKITAKLNWDIDDYIKYLMGEFIAKLDNDKRMGDLEFRQKYEAEYERLKNLLITEVANLEKEAAEWVAIEWKYALDQWGYLMKVRDLDDLARLDNDYSTNIVDELINYYLDKE